MDTDNLFKLNKINSSHIHETYTKNNHTLENNLSITHVVIETTTFSAVESAEMTA